jgi:hypothetical protein
VTEKKSRVRATVHTKYHQIQLRTRNMKIIKVHMLGFQSVLENTKTKQGLEVFNKMIEIDGSPLPDPLHEECFSGFEFLSQLQLLQEVPA